jgi:hypothetical protein
MLSFLEAAVEIYIGYIVGGGYDLYARLLARHIGKHIPGNPTVIAKNMEGAASLRLANWLYQVAPKTAQYSARLAAARRSTPSLVRRARSSMEHDSPGSAVRTTR